MNSNIEIGIKSHYYLSIMNTYHDMSEKYLNQKMYLFQYFFDEKM